jgi:hypothetical protein
VEPEDCLPCAKESAIIPLHTHTPTNEQYEFVNVVWKQTVQCCPWPTCRSQVIRQLVTTWPNPVLFRLVHRHPNLQAQDRDVSYSRLSFGALDWDAELLLTHLSVGRGGGLKVTQCCSVPQLMHGYGFGFFGFILKRFINGVMKELLYRYCSERYETNKLGNVGKT